MITNNSDTCPYRAYLENVFSYGSDVKDNQLKAAQFWSEDEPGAFEDLSNASITDRGKRIAKSKHVELQGKLYLDLATQDKYLPNGLEFKVSKGAKIRYRYNQVPHLTQDTKWKVTNSQLDTTNESHIFQNFTYNEEKAGFDIK